MSNTLRPAGTVMSIGSQLLSPTRMAMTPLFHRPHRLLRGQIEGSAAGQHQQPGSRDGKAHPSRRRHAVASRLL